MLLDQLLISATAVTRPDSQFRCFAVCDILHADPADSRTLAELGRAVGASVTVCLASFVRTSV